VSRRIVLLDLIGENTSPKPPTSSSKDEIGIGAMARLDAVLVGVLVVVMEGEEGVVMMGETETGGV